MVRKIFLTFAILFACALLEGPILSAQQNSTTIFRHAYVLEDLTISSSSTPFTASKVTSSNNPLDSANMVVFRVNCASGTSCILRFTMDGVTTPTTTVGLRAAYLDTVTLYSHDNIVAFRGIRETSTDVIIDVQYFR